MSKKSFGAAPISPPLLIIVAGEKGGVGKSLTSLAIADTFKLNEEPLTILQVDSQARLGAALGQEIVTIRVDHKLARRDPAASARAYTPIYEAIAAIPETGRSVLVDVGANEGTGLAHWMGLVDLAGDLADWQIPVLLVVPYLAEGEAIRQAGRTVELLAPQLGSPRLLLIENQRDGQIGDLHPASDALAAHRRIVAPLLKQADLIHMPLVEAGSWRPFEAAGCRPIDVAAMEVADVMRVTGLPRPEAKIVRGDVAAWLSEMLDGISQVIAFGQEDRS